MKKTSLIAFLLLLVFTLAAVTAEQILASEDVMAYILEGKVYLMDINTGKELKVKTATDSDCLLWDSSGQQLYRFTYTNVEGSLPAKGKISLYQIVLPTLVDTKIADFEIDNPDSLLISMAWNQTGSIAFLKQEIDLTALNAPRKPAVESGYFDLNNNVYTPVLSDYKDKIYMDKLHKPVNFSGYRIESILVEDKLNGNHCELFAIPEQDNEKKDFVQLTKYHNSDMFGISHLHQLPLDYSACHTGDRVLVSYHYYINDTNADYCQTFLAWLDKFNNVREKGELSVNLAGTEGYTKVNVNQITTQISGMVGTVLGVNFDEWYEWTSDGRLVFCREAASGADKMTICTMGDLPVEKVLKTYKGTSSSYLYYRSKK